FLHVTNQPDKLAPSVALPLGERLEAAGNDTRKPSLHLIQPLHANLVLWIVLLDGRQELINEFDHDHGRSELCPHQLHEFTVSYFLFQEPGQVELKNLIAGLEVVQGLWKACVEWKRPILEQVEVLGRSQSCENPSRTFTLVPGELPIPLLRQRHEDLL